MCTDQGEGQLAWGIDLWPGLATPRAQLEKKSKGGATTLSDFGGLTVVQGLCRMLDR